MNIKKPYLVINADSQNASQEISEVFNWIKSNKVNILNVAGPRQSEWKSGYIYSKMLIYLLIKEIRCDYSHSKLYPLM